MTEAGKVAIQPKGTCVCLPQQLLDKFSACKMKNAIKQREGEAKIKNQNVVIAMAVH